MTISSSRIGILFGKGFETKNVASIKVLRDKTAEVGQVFQAYRVEKNVVSNIGLRLRI